jgi:hypothetical protein
MKGNGSVLEKNPGERLVGPRAALRGTVYQEVQKEKQLGSRRLGLYPTGRCAGGDWGGHIHYQD